MAVALFMRPVARSFVRYCPNGRFGHEMTYAAYKLQYMNMPIITEHYITDSPFIAPYRPPFLKLASNVRCKAFLATQ